MSLKFVEVSPAKRYEENRALLDALEQLFPIRFCTGNVAPDACLLFQEAEFSEGGKGGAPTLVVATAGQTAPQRARITFGSDPAIHPAFRGQILSDTIRLSEQSGTAGPQTVLASVDGAPSWSNQGNRSWTCVFPLPLKTTERLLHRFSGSNWFELLPLLHFLHALTADTRWKPASLKACFVLDDLNLHATGYGYVDFRELAHHAAALNYHVAFATVPLDLWYARRSAIALVREHSRHLSLIVHGNDHTRTELYGSRSDEQIDRLLSQAVRRVEAFESHSGLHVGRLMVAPRGACSLSVLAAACERAASKAP